jgi:DinB superfamily
VSRWIDWHAAYDEPDSRLARRLAMVQGCIAGALDSAPPGPVRAISMCAGEGRDLLGVVAHHPRGDDVIGRLVELDPVLAGRARVAFPARIEIRCGDASTTSAYEGAVPADLVLVCGVFGNIGDDDIVRTINTLPSLCASGATVIWTRHRQPPDRTGLARDAFAAAGFDEVAFEAPEDFLFGIGVNRLSGDPPPFEAGVEMFAFVGYDALDGRCATCAFVYDLDRAMIVRRMEADAVSFVARMRELDDAGARRRPAPDVWSPLEYACHVRDMLLVQRDRVELIQREDVPTLTPMQRDARVTDDRYNEQEPAVVARDLLDAARSLGELLDALGDAGWRRTAVYSYPVSRLRTVEWIGNHTVHELQHHRFDISPQQSMPAAPAP